MRQLLVDSHCGLRDKGYPSSVGDLPDRHAPLRRRPGVASRRGRIAIVLSYCYLMALGYPFKWSKTRGGLRYGWNLASYQLRPLGLESEQDARDPNAEDVYGVRLNVVDEAIQSDYFWGYLHGIELIAQTLERCLQWAESCPCHWERDNTGVDGLTTKRCRSGERAHSEHDVARRWLQVTSCQWFRRA